MSVLTKLDMLLVGCGAMGSSMLRGWITDSQNRGHITVVNPDEGKITPYRQGLVIDWFADPSKLPSKFIPDAVIFAVKPQIMAEVMPLYRRFVGEKTTFISIAAGITTDFMHNHLGNEASCARVMPNMAAAYNKAMCVAYGTREPTERIFAPLGHLEWIGDEELFDAVTAVSGSGPAYLYYLCETLTKAGIAAGLSPTLSATISRQTMIGAAELMYHDVTVTPAELRAKITSPGGTTEAALAVLTPELEKLMTTAVAAATQRSKDLAKG